MRGQMPFPDPFLPIIIIATVIVALASLVRTCFQKMNHDESGLPFTETIPTAPADNPPDPFAGPPVGYPVGDPVKITTKFVETGAGTEELKFDWILGPHNLWNDAHCPED